MPHTGMNACTYVTLKFDSTATPNWQQTNNNNNNNSNTNNILQHQLEEEKKANTHTHQILPCARAVVSRDARGVLSGDPKPPNLPHRMFVCVVFACAAADRRFLEGIACRFFLLLLLPLLLLKDLPKTPIAPRRAHAHARARSHRLYATWTHRGRDARFRLRRARSFGGVRVRRKINSEYTSLTRTTHPAYAPTKCGHTKHAH